VVSSPRLSAGGSHGPVSLNAQHSVVDIGASTSMTAHCSLADTKSPSAHTTLRLLRRREPPCSDFYYSRLCLLGPIQSRLQSNGATGQYWTFGHDSSRETATLDLRQLHRVDCASIVAGCEKVIDSYGTQSPIHGLDVERKHTTRRFKPETMRADACDFWIGIKEIANELLQCWDDLVEMDIVYPFVSWAQLLFDLALLVGLLSPLSSGMRRLKLCLSMPWAMSPTLAVLWGVCWMFYSGDQVWEPDVMDALDAPGVLELLDYFPDGTHENGGGQGK
jgi:hypothetical protein